jgi:hypothetical protein
MAAGRDSGGYNRPRLVASGLRPDVAGGILSTLRSIPVTEDGPPGPQNRTYVMTSLPHQTTRLEAPALWQARMPAATGQCANAPVFDGPIIIRLPTDYELKYIECVMPLFGFVSNE